MVIACGMGQMDPRGKPEDDGVGVAKLETLSSFPRKREPSLAAVLGPRFRGDDEMVEAALLTTAASPARPCRRGPRSV